jgi:hypothetical protein
LATDEIFNKTDIGIGDEFICLGYPFGQEANKFGFPILQKGKLSSFPVVPMKKNKILKLEIKIDRGYSGGPVCFIASDITNNKVNSHVETNQFIAGVTTSVLRKFNVNQAKEITDTTVFADIVPAIFIKETIDKLPINEK